MLLQEPIDGSPRRDHREVALALTSPRGAAGVAIDWTRRSDGRGTAETIVREAGGNPYFVYELVEYLTEGDTGEGGTLSTHFSLDSVLGRRIRKLPAEAEPPGGAGRRRPTCGKRSPARLPTWVPSGFSGLRVLRAQHLVRGTGTGTLDEVETYHDRIRETVFSHLGSRRRELSPAFGPGAWSRPEGADPDPWACISRGPAGSPRPAITTPGSRRMRPVQLLWPLIGRSQLYRRALQLGPADPAAAADQTRLGDALG